MIILYRGKPNINYSQQKAYDNHIIILTLPIMFQDGDGIIILFYYINRLCKYYSFRINKSIQSKNKNIIPICIRIN